MNMKTSITNKSIHTIWQNYQLNLEDWKEGLLENRELNNLPTDVDDDTLREEMYELNSNYLEDERMNLNLQTEGKIICIADVGLWNGRRKGYKLYGYNIGECLAFFKDCEYADFYVDRYDFKCKQTHHDGTTFGVFRELKPELSSDQADAFFWKIYNGTVTQRDITRYTRSLAKRIKAVYGW